MAKSLYNLDFTMMERLQFCQQEQSQLSHYQYPATFYDALLWIGAVDETSITRLKPRENVKKVTFSY